MKFKKPIKKIAVEADGGHTPEDERYRKKVECGWSPYTNGLSPSGLQLWLQCREQFRLCYVEGLRTTVARMGLEFGNTCHHVLEQARALKAPPSDRKWVIAKVLEYYNKWRKEHPASGTASLETMDLVCGFAEAVLPVYFKRYAGDWKNQKYPASHKGIKIGGSWIGLESKFRIPYRFDDGKVMWLTGRRDGVFKTPKGFTWIFDTKCYSIFNAGELMDMLPYDVQQMFYAYASSVELQRPVDGVMLDVIRRPGHRRGAKETKKAYFDRVTKEVANPANWDHYFYRPECEIRRKELQDFKLRFLDPCLADFRTWWEGSSDWCDGMSYHYTNPMALTNKYGRCDYFEQITKGHSAELVRMTQVAAGLVD